MDHTYIVNNTILRDGESENDYFEIEFNPPLKFPDPNSKPGHFTKVVEGSLCAVCISTICEGLTRAVIHKAERLWGDKGISYGDGPSLIFDHIPNLIGLMEHIGYTEYEPESATAPDTASFPPKSHTWEIWPAGASQWLLTHDEGLARYVYQTCGRESVKEYVEVPLSFS